MNRDDVIRMAREADPFGDDGRLVSLAMLTPGTLERFAALVAAAEREACAKACEAIEAERWKAYKTGTPEHELAANVKSAPAHRVAVCR